MSYFSSLCLYRGWCFFLACAEGEQISFLFDCIVRGISPSRGPFGLRPVLPGEIIFVEVCDVRSQFKDLKVAVSSLLASLAWCARAVSCVCISVSKLYVWLICGVKFPSLSLSLTEHSCSVQINWTGFMLRLNTCWVFEVPETPIMYMQ